MTTIVWSTESVDTSAMLLTQALEDVLFTSGGHVNRDATDEITDALRDPENNVIFYGVVRLPEWFSAGFFDQSRMFNAPMFTKPLLRKITVFANLSERGVGSVQYYKLGERTTYTSIREQAGHRFDMFDRIGGQLVATVENATEFNNARGRATFACQHIDAVKKIRVFLGLPDVVDGGVIGASLTEKRRLTFFESLTYGAGVDVRNHIRRQFDEGILTEEMGAGQGTREAWTEQTHMKADDIDAGLLASLQGIASAMNTTYPNVDFCALDLVGDTTGALHVTNYTASPSLTADEVLDFVSTYYSNLLDNGRKMTRDRLTRLVQSLSEDQIVEAARILRREGVLAAAR